MGDIKDIQARRIKPGDKPISSGVTGLTLQPSTAPGRGKWNLRYVSPITGKRHDMGMGVYPDVTVAAALANAREARAQIAAGDDPLRIRRAKKAIPTFEQATRTRWSEKAPGFRNDKVRTQWLTTIERHIWPHIGGIRVDLLTVDDFADALNPIWTTIPATAKRLKQHCSDVMASCQARRFIVANPLDVVDRLLPSAPQNETHHPAMPWRLVPDFARDHLARQPVIGARAALLFAILTAARSGEVRGAIWGEIDTDNQLWTVPASRMKGGKEHRVPLSDDALALVRAQWQDDTTTPPADALVFPALRGGQLSDMALTSLLRRAQAPSGDGAGRTATAHGFRSSFRDWAADHNFDTAMAERALAHAIGSKTQAAYERTDRLKARVAMMLQWSNHVMGRTSARVMPIRGAA